MKTTCNTDLCEIGKFEGVFRDLDFRLFKVELVPVVES